MGRHVISEIKQWIWLRLDVAVNRLCESTHPSAAALLKFLDRCAPRLAVRLRFRQGNLTQALFLAHRARDLFMVSRVEQMLSPAESHAISIAPRKSKIFNRRVLQVVHSAKSFDTNGYAIRSEQIIHALRERDIESVVVTRFGYPWDLRQHMAADVVGTTRSNGIEYHHLFDPARSIGGPEREYIAHYSEALIEIAKSSDCSVIHAHSNFLNGLAASVAGAVLGIPVVYEMRGLWHLTRATREKAYLGTEHFNYCESREVQAAKNAQAVIAISQPLAEWLVQSGVERRAVSIVGNACMRQDPVPSVQNTKNCVGYIGSLVPYEGLSVLIEAMSIVRRQVPDAKAIIVGGGSILAQLQRRVAQKNLTANFVFTGSLPSEEAYKYYELVDAIVIPRLSNQLTEMIPPLKPMEALGRGVPVIVSDVAPLRQVIAAQDNGLLFAAGDHEKLAECILQIFADALLRQRLSDNGLLWAAEHSWAANAAAYEQIYGGLYSQGTSYF